MSIHDWFKKKKESRISNGYAEKLDTPGNLWVKCRQCRGAIYARDLEENQKVCPKCGYHFRLTWRERLDLTVDPDSFREIDAKIRSKDFLLFSDAKPYARRIDETIAKSGLQDAVVCGLARIARREAAIAVMDFSFMGGSMGSVVGEKITRLIEAGSQKRSPVIVFSSSGGARMQEGIMSLMQMAKTSAALGRLRENRLPYISVMTDPTTGGTSASYAMLGDINIAEPGALIGFAGPRVIEQTIRQKLPPDFQRAEYLREHGMVDIVVERKELRSTLIKIISWYYGK